MARPKIDVQGKMEELAQRAASAEVAKEEIKGREQLVRRFSKEMAGYREDNHFTDLFIKTVGAQR